MSYIKDYDLEVYNAIQAEEKRQEEGIELIASENFVSKAVMEAAGSVFTNKYAEGYPGKRYYGGCVNVDTVETLAIERLKKIFGAKFANVQPHSGSQANMGVYVGLLDAGDKILGMGLSSGGHLTHGYKINFSGKNYVGLEYGLDPETELIDYDKVREIALAEKPKMIVAGASAYSRIIDFKRFREIADEVGAYLMVDMAHIAGLVATGHHPSPLPYADVVTSTTHKTLRGPRGGIILTNNEIIATKINKMIFPGAQGGPLEHIVAAKAICFGEALKPEFKIYQEQVLKNMQAMVKTFKENNIPVISNGSDNHLCLIDTYTTYNVTGHDASNLLSKAQITCNKNGIPFDTLPPMKTSGLRLGAAAMTTKGYTEDDFVEITNIICNLLKKGEEYLPTAKSRVNTLVSKNRKEFR